MIHQNRFYLHSVMDTADKGSKVTLSGSEDTIADYFYYAINSILYQRGLYSTNRFVQKKKFGMKLFIITDKQIQEYLQKVNLQMKSTPFVSNFVEWVKTNQVQKFVLAIRSVKSGKVVENWHFEINYEQRYSIIT